MDIAALAMTMKQAELMQNVSLAVTKQAMEFQEQSAEQLLEVIDAPHPTLGQTIDISV
ncbi:YjfB family protein [Solibacillus silvestris]|uniref:YjfB family protein n=1 Tax=Solibacillus silvestris TaxID=76853 RepID=UPI003F81F481